MPRQAAEEMHLALLKASDATPYRKLMLQAYELAADAFTSTAAERMAKPESFWVKRIADPSGTSAAFGAFEGKGTLLLLLTVTEGNAPAESLYKSAGFQSFGIEPMAILTPAGYKAKIHMWLPLQRNASEA